MKTMQQFSLRHYRRNKSGKCIHRFGNQVI